MTNPPTTAWQTGPWRRRKWQADARAAGFGDVWRYLSACGPRFQVEPVCLCRKIVRGTGRPLGLSQLLTCLDIFQEGGLLTLERQHKFITITLTAGAPKADLTQSDTMRYLQQLKES
ncbi:MAG: hypothetical protein ACLU9S_12500 [Oscillospiraceae bacterium]